MALLRTQEVWIFNAVSAEGFDPREFDLVNDFPLEGQVVPTLIHRPSGFYFSFRRHLQQEGFWVAFSPAAEANFGSYGTGGWDSVVAPQFSEWLRRVHRETEAPDLWGELRREDELIGAPTEGAENTPFSPEEQAEVRRQQCFN